MNEGSSTSQVLGALGCFGGPPGTEGEEGAGAGGEPTGGAHMGAGAPRRPPPPAAEPTARRPSNAPPVGCRRPLAA